jgi:signal peptide peptidase SppA
MLTVVAGIIGRRVAGLKATDEEIAAALVNRKNLPQPTGGSVAVIPVYGVIAPRANMMSDMSGGTSFQQLTSALHEAMANKAIKTIVLDIDSPGGSVAGATEFAREVMKARTKKPIIAVAQYTMASAAYWVGAAATEVVAAPSAHVGSVGVYTMHEDISEALAALGVKRTYISAGKYKTDGNEAEPLSPEAQNDLQAKVDAAYAMFLGDISKGRGVNVADVRSGYGQGRMLPAAEALAAGMVDRIATLDDTLARVLSGSATGERMAAETPTISAPDTPQEPARATGQDRLTTMDWQQLEVELLGL